MREGLEQDSGRTPGGIGAVEITYVQGDLRRRLPVYGRSRGNENEECVDADSLAAQAMSSMCWRTMGRRG